jgi:thiol-disulfide isomerase/thioredoxin
MLKKYLSFTVLSLLANFSVLAQLKVGQVAPEIVITNWLKNVPKSRELSDKFIVIDFWATWCAPCLETVPHFNQMVKEHKSNPNLVFLALTDEKITKVMPLLKRIPFDAVVVTDTTRQTSNSFKANTIPFCVIIDNKNKIRWFGHSGSLNSKIISNILAGKPIDTEKMQEISSSDDIDKLYNELDDRYAVYFEDAGIKEYFSMGPVTTKPFGSVRLRGGSKKFPYKEVVIGCPLVPRISTLLDVSPTQIVIPEKLQGSCISYCYKSELKNDKKNVLDTILHQLKLEYIVKDSLVDAIVLEVENRTLLEKYASDSLAHMSRSSSSDSYAAIEDHVFSNMATLIQEKVKKVVIVQNDAIFSRNFSMTIKYDNLSVLTRSLKHYGIKVTTVKRKMPIYRFEQKG